ncbi:transcription factor bHLH18 [Medicago truncatula]|uniref:transcription factor bHLH18 n=1 Tax=Medicago truncatula TaxID=3880 RepID=UPI0019672CB4|nr:transcription factor bHLH18 [Medicago truncatula]
MGYDKSHFYLDEDKFQREIVQHQPSFSFESGNSQSSTIQYMNNIVDNVCVTNTVHENIAQEYTCATNSQQLPPSQYILSFENSTMQPSPNSDIATCSSIMVQETTTLNNNVSSELPKIIKKRTKNLRSSCEMQDHIMAERKRRQVLTERFIALSATIPGLKKTGKVYILQEAINYVKQLQERVKKLEKEVPRVEARVIDKEILIGIHCEKQKDIVVRLMALLQNLHLSVASRSSVLPFGSSTLKVTIIAQVVECMNMFGHIHPLS